MYSMIWAYSIPFNDLVLNDIPEPLRSFLSSVQKTGKRRIILETALLKQLEACDPSGIYLRKLVFALTSKVFSDMPIFSVNTVWTDEQRLISDPFNVGPALEKLAAEQLCKGSYTTAKALLEGKPFDLLKHAAWLLPNNCLHVEWDMRLHSLDESPDWADVPNLATLELRQPGAKSRDTYPDETILFYLGHPDTLHYPMDFI